MARSRDEIMTQWVAIRDKIAGGCTHDGPRLWFEGVMDEQDNIIAGLVREMSRLKYFEDAYRSHGHWNDEAKRAAGYHVNVSFDDVWAEALAAVLEKRGPTPAKR